MRTFLYVVLIVALIVIVAVVALIDGAERRDAALAEITPRDES